MSPDARPAVVLCSLGVQYADARHAAPHLSVPLALGYLVSGMEAAGLLARCRVEILGPFESLFAADAVIADAVARHAPAIVGMSCYCWNVDRSLFIAARIKARCPDAAIVLGGPEATERATALLERQPHVSAVVRGEGEESFPELLAFLLRGGTGPPPRGCVVRTPDGLEDGGPREPVASPGTLPSPYLRGHLDPRVFGALNIETVRGCLFRCDYCYYPKGIRALRPFPAERIRDEVRLAATAGVTRGYLMDPVFNLPDRIEEVCGAIASGNEGRRIEFRTEVRAELIDANAVELLVRANVRSVEIGLQSTNTAALRGVHRGFASGRFTSAVARLARAGIEVHAGVIVGLPGDRLADVEETLDFALSLPVSGIHCFLLQVLPGTALWRDAQALGLEHQPEPPYFVLATRQLDGRELRIAHARAVQRVRAARGAHAWLPDVAWPAASVPS